MTPNAFKAYMSKLTFKPTKATCPESFANISKLHMIVGVLMQHLGLKLEHVIEPLSFWVWEVCHITTFKDNLLYQVVYKTLLK